MVLNNDTREAIFVILDYFTNKGNMGNIDDLKDTLMNYVDEKLETHMGLTKEDTSAEDSYPIPVINVKTDDVTVKEIEDMFDKYELDKNGDFKPKQKNKTPKLTGMAMYHYRKEHPTEEFIFKKIGEPTEYRLNGKKIYGTTGKNKNKKLPISIETAYALKKIMEDNNNFTNGLYFKCTEYLKKHEPKMKRYVYQDYLQKIWRGDFDKVIKEYRESLKVKMNPQFNVNRGKLVVDNVNTNLSLETVNKILDNIPVDADKLDDYITKTINRYLRCPESSIRTIINNYDNYSLLKILKRKTNKRNDLHYGWK